jgi:hypothetical protein
MSWLDGLLDACVGGRTVGWAFGWKGWLDACVGGWVGWVNV